MKWREYNMKLPRQPEVVSIAITCPHEGDATDAKDLIIKHLENRFDQVQCWKDSVGVYIIKCYPRAVND